MRMFESSTRDRGTLKVKSSSVAVYKMDVRSTGWVVSVISMLKQVRFAYTTTVVHSTVVPSVVLLGRDGQEGRRDFLFGAGGDGLTVNALMDRASWLRFGLIGGPEPGKIHTVLLRVSSTCLQFRTDTGHRRHETGDSIPQDAQHSLIECPFTTPSTLHLNLPYLTPYRRPGSRSPPGEASNIHLKVLCLTPGTLRLEA